MKKTVRIPQIIIIAILFVFAAGKAGASGDVVDDTWLKLSFESPAGWKKISSKNFKFSFIEMEPAYVFQKDDEVIFILNQQNDGFSLREVTDWMVSKSAGSLTSNKYRYINKRLVSEYIVRGAGNKIGSIPALAGSQVDNAIVSFNNERWFIRVIYSSPNRMKYREDFEQFLQSIEFKGEEHQNDKSIAERYGLTDDEEKKSGAGNSDESDSGVKLMIKIPTKKEMVTKNSVTSLQVVYSNSISRVKITLNGKKYKADDRRYNLESDEEETKITTVAPLEIGPNTIKVQGVNSCGKELEDSVIVVRESEGTE